MFTEAASELTSSLLVKYRATLSSFGESVMKIKANANSVLDIFIGTLIGCSHIEVEFPFTYSEKGLSLCVDFNTFNKDEDYGVGDVGAFDYSPKVLDFNSKEFEGDLNLIEDTCECFV